MNQDSGSFLKSNKFFVSRNLVVKKKYEVVQAKIQKREQLKEVCFVWLGGTIDEFINTLSKVRSFVQPEAYIK
jgi:hypothetical protein